MYQALFGFAAFGWGWAGDLSTHMSKGFSCDFQIEARTDTATSCPAPPCCVLCSLSIYSELYLVQDSPVVARSTLTALWGQYKCPLRKKMIAASHPCCYRLDIECEARCVRAMLRRHWF